VIDFHVPTMSSRESVRVISARLCDVAGVRTVEADLATRTVVVTGSADPADLRVAISAAGHDPGPGGPIRSSTRAPLAAGSSMALPTHATAGLSGHDHSGRAETVSADLFSTDVTGLPNAVQPTARECADGASTDLRIVPVAKRLGDDTLRMLAYEGSVPGPTLVVRQGAHLSVLVTNATDLETTVHWHGLRVDNQFDGVPHETQQPIGPAESFTYRLDFPDPGLYWYHPHVREDYTQEMGLYGTVLVRPTQADYWPPVHRDVVLALDDVLIEDGAIAPFDRSQVTHAAMGRFGNVFLVNGETEPALAARAGEVVRLWLVNTANARVFDVRLPGARMKLVGGDGGRVEHEEFVDSVLVAPSERAVVDVMFQEPGALPLEHRTPDRTYPLGRVTVTEEPAEPSLRDSFETLRTDPELAVEREQLQGWLDARPDKVLAAVAEMDDVAGTASMSHDMSSMRRPEPAGDGHGHVHGGVDGIEWEDDMAAVNRRTTPANTRWTLRDRTSGGTGSPVEWNFAVGERVKIRLVNEMDSDHPMHHPFHVHGAGRFLVLARDGVPEPNLVWKDTVLLRAGQTVDILFSATNPGFWMAHCHIPEHMHSGMMFHFTVGAPA